jgi:TonB-dependent starch-binding outer membrane protein SusC
MRTGYTYRILLFLFLFIGIHTILRAQIQVTGVVTDNESSTMPGVKVIVKGTKTVAVTDILGSYQIEVPEAFDELMFTFIGFESKTVKINKTAGSKQILSIVLDPKLETLNEVVIIGYGTVKKQDLTGAVSVITASDLTRTPIPNVSKAIQGKASGVVVLQNGEPGGGVNIRVRGIGSINDDPDPLYVVDGIVGVDINSIAPEDIESISVLKDASSSAIYGANAANGVIVVTTKRGVSSDKPKVSFSMGLAINQRAKKFDLMNANEYASFYNEVYKLNNVIPHAAYSDNFRQQYYKDGDWKNGTDWQDEILQDNLSQSYYLNISHGNAKSNYSLTFNYYDEEGMLKNSSSQKFNIRANSDFHINQYVKVGETISLNRRNHKDPDNNAWGMSLEATPLMNIYNPENKEGYEGTQIPFGYTTESGIEAMAMNTGGNDKFNPVGILSIPDKNKTFDNILADVYIEIKPLKGLTFKSSASINAYTNEEYNWTPAYDMGSRSVNTASLSHGISRGQTLMLKNQFSYNRTFGLHNIDAIAVHDVSQGTHRGMSGSASGFPYEQLPVLSQGESKDVTGGEYEDSRLSYLGRIMYNYNSKYLLSASIRRDGSYKFAEGNRWGTFPAFSLGWKINEDFLKNVHQIDMLKLRYGWGMTGNSHAAGSFDYQTRIGTPDTFRPVFGLDSKQAYALNEDVWNPPGNPLIQWEAAQMTNIGIDLNAFKNKIQFSAEYYNKKQDELIMEVPISYAHGTGINWNPGTPKYNIADIENKGFEFDIRYNQMEGSFNYKIFANLSTVNNNVTSIPSAIINTNNITMEGYPIGSIYGYKAERILQESDFDSDGNYLHEMPATGKPSPGDLKFTDVNLDKKINDDDRTIIGKTIPDFTYSFGFECYYKDFDFSVFFYGVQNVEILNSMRKNIESFRSQDMDHNKSADWAANYYGKGGNPSTEYVRADRNDANQNSRGSSWWVDDASFLRVKDLQIGYTIPKNILQRVGISSTRIYISGMNLYTFTNYKGYDPESPLNNDTPTQPGIDENKYPIPRVFNFGIQMSL